MVKSRDLGRVTQKKVFFEATVVFKRNGEKQVLLDVVKAVCVDAWCTSI